MSRFIDINEWSEYWLEEYRKNRDYWAKNDYDINGYLFKLVFDTPKNRNAAYHQIRVFWDGGGWGTPEGYIETDCEDNVLCVYLTCPETPMVIRVARNFGGKVRGWDNRFLEEPPENIPYWIPTDHRLELVEKKSKKQENNGCYIASSIYGSYDCPEVWTLRRYRDNVLDNSWYGRLFIRCYYAVSPTLVKQFGGTKLFREIFYKPLDFYVEKLNKRGFENTPYTDKY